MKREIEPWTLGTFPYDRPLWVRHNTGENFFLAVVVTWDGIGIMVGNKKEILRWQELAKEWVQTNGQPCGQPKKKGKQT